MSPARWKRSCGRSRRAARGWLGAKMNWMSGAAARLELEFLADGRLDALLARAAVVGAQHLHDAGAVVVVARALKLAWPSTVAAGGAQFFVERRRDARAPVAFGHEHHAAPAAAGADVARHGARIVFR